MSTSAIMFVLGVSYFAAHLFQLLFSRFKIPDVLLFMLVGLVLGPVTGFVDVSAFGRSGDALSTLALVLILFDSGVHLDVKAFKAAWAQTLGLTVITVLATGATFYAVGIALGLSSSLSLILGAILSGTSSAVVIPMIQSLRLHPTTGTMSTIESALTDVVCIVLTTAFIKAHLSGVFSATAIGGAVGVSMVGAAAVGFALGVAWLALSRYRQGRPNTVFASLAFGLLVYGFAEAVGVSGGIAVMAYGFALANGRVLLKQNVGITDSEKAIYTELIFVLKTFFFIYLGVSLIFTDVPIIAVSFVGVVIVFLLRLVMTRLAAPRSLSLRDRSYLVLLIPKGLAAAVLANLPIQSGIAGGEKLRLIVYSVVFFSILLCAILVPFVERSWASLFLGRLLGAENQPVVEEKDGMSAS